MREVGAYNFWLDYKGENYVQQIIQLDKTLEVPWGKYPPPPDQLSEYLAKDGMDMLKVVYTYEQHLPPPYSTHTHTHTHSLSPHTNIHTNTHTHTRAHKQHTT